jgi:hypothetical protein
LEFGEIFLRNTLREKEAAKKSRRSNEADVVPIQLSLNAVLIHKSVKKM